ncbi:uncharacterized protein PV06_11234 [Exophiala oligosperma]|uniref:Uncharacterized protein n=1 Tax=Exophiala oligosperma TaxID=215243 RepID=A0A0D2CZW1_9EURO|nr:uncharacterized protein PV06_11234 [Exophiala oligosperma]KIW36523.1 hypothetical protein PV06_11234 [Exophiala oligosperma]
MDKQVTSFPLLINLIRLAALPSYLSLSLTKARTEAVHLAKSLMGVSTVVTLNVPFHILSSFLILGLHSERYQPLYNRLSQLCLKPDFKKFEAILRFGKTIRPLVPRSNSHQTTSPIQLSTSKPLSKRGRHEPSQLLADAFEEIMAECDTPESPQDADSSDSPNSSIVSDSSLTSDSLAADSSIVATVHNVADPDTRARSPAGLPSLDSEVVGLSFDRL